MAIYKNITTDQVYPNGHTLISKIESGINLSTVDKGDGVMRKIIITNHHASDKNTIQLFLDDGAGSPTRYTIAKSVIAAGATLVLTDGITFDITKYSMKLSTVDTTATALTVIIK